MKVAQEFVVGRSPDVVWQFFQDVESVAQCLPGAELTGQTEDGAYEGKVSSKLGPMTATFEGKAVVTTDVASMSGTIDGKGVDKLGGSRGQVNVKYVVQPDDAGSRVSLDANIQLSGPAAQFGRTGLINEMSRRLIEDFVSCLEAKLDAGTEEEAEAIQAADVKGVSLFFASLWVWFKNLFRKQDR